MMIDFTSCGWLYVLGAGMAAVVVVDLLYNFLNGLRIHFFSADVNLKETFGDWAVVTGCTDGIGKAYAHELAKRGINIVLISRTLDKLKDVAKDIETEHGVKTKIIAVNLSDGKLSVDAVKAQLGDQKVDILVNNVGCATVYPKYVLESSEEELWNQINLNVGFTTLITRLVLAGMKERKKGAVVNVSSLLELTPWPLFDVYAATKIYIKHFTEGLILECGNTGITIQKLAPGFVATKMTDYNREARRSILMSTDPETYARHAVNTLGKTDSTTGYWKHGILYYMLSRMPSFILKASGLALNKRARKLYFEQENLTPPKED